MIRYLIPDERVEAVSDIVPEALVYRGIRGLIVDLDDTLVQRTETVPAAAVCDWLNRTRRLLGMVILSNNQSASRVAAIADTWEIPFIHLALKPLPKGFYQALQLLELPAWRVAVIGDRLFTDILGGNRIGAHTILVESLGIMEQRWMHRLVRRAERIILASWQNSRGNYQTTAAAAGLLSPAGKMLEKQSHANA